MKVPAYDRRDLESGEWGRRYGELRDRPSLDIGLRLVIAELGQASPRERS